MGGAMSKLDINKPWLKAEVPDVYQEFNCNSDPLFKLQMQDIQQKESQGSGSLATHQKKPLTYEFDPPSPEYIRKQNEQELLFRHWLAQQRQSAMAAAYSKENKEDHVKNYHQSQQQKENQTMTKETQNPNAPLNSYKDGAVTLKLWKQEAKDGNANVTFSVGKLYKNDQGQWRESRNFNSKDLTRLQNMIPEAIKQAHVHEAAFYSQRLAEAKSQVPHWQTQEQPAQQPSEQTSEHNMQAARDAAMQQAENANTQNNTQENAMNQNYNSSPEPNQ